MTIQHLPSQHRDGTPFPCVFLGGDCDASQVHFKTANPSSLPTPSRTLLASDPSSPASLWSPRWTGPPVWCPGMVVVRRFFSLYVHWYSEPKVHRDGCRQRTHIVPPTLGNEQHVSRSKDSLHKMGISKMGMDLSLKKPIQMASLIFVQRYESYEGMIRSFSYVLKNPYKRLCHQACFLHFWLIFLALSERWQTST